MAAPAILAAAAAVVSWDGQYVMVARARHATAIAALEAGIPDVGAAVFAALGIALALHGRRALRPRVLNVGCIGLSVTMNALAAAPGWRDVAIWVMPAALYALASDTLIGVVRAWAIARTRATGESLADTDATPLAVAGAMVLWLLRLVLAPRSTLAGFRRWVIAESPRCPSRGDHGRHPSACHRSPGTQSHTPPELGQRQAVQAGPAHRAGWPAPRPGHRPAAAGRSHRVRRRPRHRPAPRHGPARPARSRPHLARTSRPNFTGASSPRLMTVPSGSRMSQEARRPGTR
jgi:hypothetical protein